MLFLPDAVYEARARLWREFEAGEITEPQAYRKMLDMDPEDYLGLVGMGKELQEAGDLAGAEEYFWRAVQSQPCIDKPYMALSQFLLQQPDSADLAQAVAELGFAKTINSSEPLPEGMDFRNSDLPEEFQRGFRKLSVPEKRRLILEVFRRERENEPEAVTARLHRLRLIDQVQELGDLSPETVDEVVSEGGSIVPLLIGMLRGWAQDLLYEEDECAAENALALLGETASPAEIPHLLEFANLEQEDAAGASVWALGRIVERHPEASARFIESIAAGLDASARYAVMELVIRHPQLDPAGKVLVSLAENVQSMERSDRDEFFLSLLTELSALKGANGISLGRAALARHGSLLSRHGRRDCDALLNAMRRDGVPPLQLPSRPAHTVYEICAGAVIWSEDADEEDEDDYEFAEDEDFAPIAEPVRRAPVPGRNDPCWCNSGKKYKKCHLDSDESGRSGARGNLSVVPGTSGTTGGANEFEGLRNRIGGFIGEVFTEREIERGIREFFGENVLAGDLGDDEGKNITLTDWIVHDRIVPATGRPVMQEFLLRHGSGLNDRARKMVEAWSRSFVGLYEVESVTAGVGAELKDLIFGGTIFVHDVNMSTRLVRWDGLLVRVVPGERGTELGGTGVTVPRHNIEPLRAWMDERREEAGLDWASYLKRNWPRIRRHSFELGRDWMQSLQLSNTDGEELLFSKAVYTMADADAVSAALRASPVLEDESDSFVWVNEHKTVLGNIRVAGKELLLECNSRERLDRGKRLLGKLAKKWLRHVRDEFTTQKQLKSQAVARHHGTRGKNTGIPNDAEDAAITRMLEDHYRRWPDEGIPALEGKTPREAARTPEGREKLRTLLKDFENGEERKKRGGEPFYDVGRLLVELGLD